MGMGGVLVSCGVVELGFVVEFLFFGGCGDVFKFLRERFGDVIKFKFFLVVGNCVMKLLGRYMWYFFG